MRKSVMRYYIVDDELLHIYLTMFVFKPNRQYLVLLIRSHLFCIIEDNFLGDFMISIICRVDSFVR